MKALDIDLASEFIVMAATLIYIKSKILLPKPPEEEAQEEGQDPREELMRRLMEYQQYKWAAEELEKKPFLNEDVFKIHLLPKEYSSDFDPKEGLVEVGLYELALAFQDMVARSRTVVGHVEGEEYRIEDKILEIVSTLNQALNQMVELKTLFRENISKLEVVVSFLAILELAKMGYIKLFQAGYESSEIHLKAIKEFQEIGGDSIHAA